MEMDRCDRRNQKCFWLVPSFSLGFDAEKCFPRRQKTPWKSAPLLLSCLGFPRGWAHSTSPHTKASWEPSFHLWAGQLAWESLRLGRHRHWKIANVALVHLSKCLLRYFHCSGVHPWIHKDFPLLCCTLPCGAPSLLAAPPGSWGCWYLSCPKPRRNLCLGTELLPRTKELCSSVNLSSIFIYC